MFKHIKATLIILIVLMAFSCDLFQDNVSVESRIQSFEDDLNGNNYTNLYNYYRLNHPDSPSYDSYVDSSVLNSGPLAFSNAPFTFGTPVIVDSSNGKSASGTLTYNSTDFTYVFDMREDDGDWKIYYLYIGGSPIIKTLR